MPSIARSMLQETFRNSTVEDEEDVYVAPNAAQLDGGACDALSHEWGVSAGCDDCFRHGPGGEANGCIDFTRLLCDCGHIASADCSAYASGAEAASEKMQENILRLCLNDDYVVSATFTATFFSHTVILMTLIILLTDFVSARIVTAIGKWQQIRIPRALHTKCVTYFSEIIVTSVLLLFCIVHTPYVQFCKEWGAQSNVADTIATASPLLTAALAMCLLYFKEIAADMNIRWTLLAHHLLSMVVLFLGGVFFARTGYGPVLVIPRLLTTFLYHSLSEQTIFLFMLIYRLHPRPPPWLMSVLGYIYSYTRVLLITSNLLAFCLGAYETSKYDSSQVVFEGNVSILSLWLPILTVVSYSQYQSHQAIKYIVEKLYVKRLSRTRGNEYVKADLSSPPASPSAAHTSLRVETTADSKLVMESDSPTANVPTALPSLALVAYPSFGAGSPIHRSQVPGPPPRPQSPESPLSPTARRNNFGMVAYPSFGRLPSFGRSSWETPRAEIISPQSDHSNAPAKASLPPPPSERPKSHYNHGASPLRRSSSEMSAQFPDAHPISNQQEISWWSKLVSVVNRRSPAGTPAAEAHGEISH